MQKRFFTRLGFLILAVALFSLIWATRTGRLDPHPYRDRGILTPVMDGMAWPPGNIPVTLGTYVENIYDFAVQTQTFSAEGWVWVCWSQPFQDLLVTKNLTMEKCLVPANAVQAGDFMLQSDNEPQKSSDGLYHQVFRFSGKFYANKLNFRRFPFETLHFPVCFGMNPEYTFLNANHVRLVADKAQSGIGEYIDLPGYVTTGKQITNYLYTFATNLGFNSEIVPVDTRFSRVQLDVLYTKSVVASLLQLLVPLIVVMAIVLLAPNLAGSLWDVRIALPSTALLTLVFLQQSYRTQLPSLPYLTFLDQVYSLCYGTALALFCLFVWSSNRLDQAPEGKRDEVVRQINRTDLRFQIGLASALVLLTILNWFASGR